MVVAIIIVIIRVAVAVVVAVVVVVIMAAAVVIAPGKGSGKNPEKSSLRKKWRFPLGFLTRDRARVGVVGIPINISPA